MASDIPPTPHVPKEAVGATYLLVVGGFLALLYKFWEWLKRNRKGDRRDEITELGRVADRQEARIKELDLELAKRDKIIEEKESQLRKARTEADRSVLENWALRGIIEENKIKLPDWLSKKREGGQ